MLIRKYEDLRTVADRYRFCQQVYQILWNSIKSCKAQGISLILSFNLEIIKIYSSTFYVQGNILTIIRRIYSMSVRKNIEQSTDDKEQ